MKLRTNLVALVLAAMIPLVLFATVAVALLWRTDRRGTEERLRDTARALALAVDREVLSTVTTLEALTGAEELERGDLARFHAVARRVLETQRDNGWLAVILATPSGEQLVNAALPLESPLPRTLTPDALADFVASARASVSDLLVGTAVGRPVVSVRVPVRRDGAARYALAAVVDPASFVKLLRQQNLPADWLSSVFDRQGLTIARTVAPERFVGLPAGAHVLEAMKKSDEGLLRAVITRDNRSVYAGYSRAPFAGWTVTFSVPSETVEAPLQRSLVSVVGGGALLTLLGTVLAVALARRLAAPMSALARSAEAVGRGQTPPPVAGGVDEIRDVGEALARAAEDRHRTETALRQESAVLDAVNRAGRSLSAGLDLQKVVQAVTDAATTVSGAAFGAFFYNVADARGESFMLYAISGVSREAFASFPMPRNTELFGPTFRGEGPIRIDDVRKDARYGRNPPHHGMPPGHLPVASYLAVPVISRGGEVIGGLFFGHPEPARFGEREEQVVVGLAAQAAVAVDNARLYEKEQQARLEAEAANRTKDEFLATLSHELRTPLNAILGWARMLESGGLAPDVSNKALAVIARNAKMQSQLIEDLLDVSRIASGKLKLETRAMALAPVVEAALDTIRPAAAAKDIRVQTSIDSADGTVLGDPGRLQQVVWNLLSNAVKFTPRGGQVHVTLQRVDAGVEIVVADTGAGIPAALLPVIFDRFRQADSSSRRAHGGLGIGLALVRHLAEMHGGTVEARSAGEGQGATFTVRLPLLSDAAEPAAPVATPPRAAGGVLDGLKILVVDDERDALDLFATILAGAGAETRTALSSAAALEILATWVPDVLVSDIEMPGEDGYALIRRLRARGDAGASLPAVAITAYGRLEDRVRVLEAGFHMHVVKPVEPTEMVAVIASLARRATR